MRAASQQAHQQTLDTLGAGFQLASHDLDIRGAGNLLGEEQSGHIREVGIELPARPKGIDTVQVTREGAVLVITIDRPPVRNAIDRATSEALAHAMDELDADPTLVIGVLTGAGGHFCTGMDLKAFLRGERVELPGRGLAGLVQTPPRKPLIAAIEGYALAGGCEMALACDLIVAAESAQFGIPEVKRGLIAGSGGLLRLPRRIPPHIAMELALTGDVIDAATAADWLATSARTAASIVIEPVGQVTVPDE